MVARLRRFFDIRPGEGLPVLLSFTYIGVVIASYVLARAIRNGLFIQAYGPYALVYVAAASPVVLSLFVPAYTALAARLGARRVTTAALLFLSLNVLVFWYAFRQDPTPRLTAVFYVWVNCFGVIAPVHAWSYASALFDTRQAKRLFGLIGSGASLGAIVGGFLARVLVEPMGGSINLLLVLALLILLAAVVVTVANTRIRRRGAMRIGRPTNAPLMQTARAIIGSPYLRLIAAVVFLTAIVTQWTGLQLSLVTSRIFNSDATALTRFNGTFTLALGTVSFLVQLFATSQALRKFGLAVTILALPLSLGLGSALIVLLPAVWPVIMTNAFDQGLRFSVDRPTYELLYLPIAPQDRLPLKSAIDIIGTRVADAVGAVLYGILTVGFLMLPGVGLELRGTALVNLLLISGWVVVAWRLRSAYVRTIQDSIHRHRIDTERTSPAVLERSAAEALRAKLAADDPGEVRYALSLLEGQRTQSWHPALRALLQHEAPDVRQRALALLAAAGDHEIGPDAVALLRDPDLGVRTEALLYLSRERGIDPLVQIETLGDFADFSIRAGMAAFLASPGPAQNLETARTILDTMARAEGPSGGRERAEAARLIGLVPDAFSDMLPALLADQDLEVVRQAIQTADAMDRDDRSDALVAALIATLGRAEVSDEAGAALAHFGDAVVPEIARRIEDEQTSLEVRRELPSVLVRIGTAGAEQVLIGSLLHADPTLRHRVIASLNKLRTMHPEVRLDPAAVELLLAAEIVGHYRSYQVLGPLQDRLRPGDPVLEAMGHSMEQELERIFRVMAILLPHAGLHDAYVGLRSSNPVIRGNAIEFLDNVLKPELRQVLVPLLDSSVTVAERIALANTLVGAPLDTPEQAVSTLLASEDSWLRSCAVYAIGAMQLESLEGVLDRFERDQDPAMQQTVQNARRRLAGLSDTSAPQEPPVPPSMGVGVGSG
jgi:AAA family ATP:ADP antiporter